MLAQSYNVNLTFYYITTHLEKHKCIMSVSKRKMSNLKGCHMTKKSLSNYGYAGLWVIWFYLQCLDKGSSSGTH